MSWPTVKLGDCVQPVKNWNPLRAGDTDTFSYIDIASVDQIRKKILDVKLLECKNAPSRARQLVATDDVLVSTVRPNLNAVAIVQPSLHQATASTGFCVIRANPSLLDSAYLFNWVQTSVFIGDMVNKATGASYPAVTDKIIFDSEIPLPPLAEQKRIAAILDKADEIRRKREQTIAKLDQLAQSIFVEMFGDPISNAKGYKTGELGSGITLVGGGAFKSSDFLDDGIPLIRIGEVNRQNFDGDGLRYLPTDFENQYSRFIVKNGDLLMSLTGTTGKDDYGNVTLVNGAYKRYFLNQRVALIRPIENIFINEYLLYFLKNKDIKNRLITRSRGVRQANISNGDITSLAVQFPPLASQIKFQTIIQKINECMATANNKLVKSNLLFNSLQHQAFTGNL